MEKNGDHLFGGLGLGLSIAKQVIQQHKGTLSVDSFPGHGSTFRILLPAWRR
jgi:signal transduction histidine kinase